VVIFMMCSDSRVAEMRALSFSLGWVGVVRADTPSTPLLAGVSLQTRSNVTIWKQSGAAWRGFGRSC
jgi:hypothetical protein